MIGLLVAVLIVLFVFFYKSRWVSVYSCPLRGGKWGVVVKAWSTCCDTVEAHTYTRC